VTVKEFYMDEERFELRVGGFALPRTCTAMPHSVRQMAERGHRWRLCDFGTQNT